MFFVMFLLAEIPEGKGEVLQLFSYYTTRPPVINGCITDGTNPAGSATPGTDYDEWEGAYSRTLVLRRDTGDSTEYAVIYLMNDDNYLYVALVYKHGNNGDPNAVTLYFDEGDGGGENDETLTVWTGQPRGENAVYTQRVSGSGIAEDLSWDGSGWSDDPDGFDFEVYDGYQENIYTWEFKIPLHNGRTNGEDLNVSGEEGRGDELGFLLKVFKNGDPDQGTYYWEETNGNENDPTGSPIHPAFGNSWAEIRLGVPRKFVTFSATVNANGNPVVDGDISEDAWRGCYERRILLTNFHGDTIGGRIYFVHDYNNEKVYVGVKVFDQDNNSGDYIRIYQEQDPGTGTRNYHLDDSYENALEARADGSFIDRYFYVVDGSPGLWVDDGGVEGADLQDGVIQWYGDHYEAEYVLGLDLGLYDLTGTPEDGKTGFLIRFHDEDMPDGEKDYWWEYTTNSDAQYVEGSTTGNTNLSIGWAYLQLGAPYLQIIHPQDGDTIEGTYPVDAYAEAIGGVDSIVAVEFQIVGEATWRSLVRTDASGFWSGNFDSRDYADGWYQMAVRAVDTRNDTTTQIIDIFINNTGVEQNAPVVEILSPSASEIVNGTVTITWNSTPQGSNLLVADSVQIDGGDWVRATTLPPDTGGTGTYNWNTTTLPDGSHTIRVKSTDNMGLTGYSDIRLVYVDNTPPSLEDLEVVLPAGQTAVKAGDEVTISVRVTDNIAGVQSVVLDATNLDGATHNMTNVGNDTYSVTLTITNGGTGDFNFTITATDNIGNARNLTSSISIDNTPPSITGISVEGDTLVKNGETVKLVVQTDTTGYTVGADFSTIDSNYETGNEEVVDNGDGSYTVTYTISTNNTTPDGRYQVIVSATDGAGNVTTGGIYLTLDNSGPQVLVLTLDDPDRIINQSDTLRAVVFDTCGVVEVEYFVDNTGYDGDGIPMLVDNPGADSVNAKALLDISSLTDGVHTVYAHGKDSSGVWGPYASLDFVIDREPPELVNLEVVYPEGQHAVRNGQEITIRVEVRDATTQVDSVWVDATSLGGGILELTDTDGDFVYEVTFVVNAGGDGDLPFVVYAHDAVPNTGSVGGMVKVDNTPPQITGIEVYPDSLVRNGETVLLTVSTDGTGYNVKADFSEIDDGYVEGGEVVEDRGDSTYEISYMISLTNSVPDGTYPVRITVEDSVGNFTVDSILLILDNSGPTVDTVGLVLDPGNDLILNENDTVFAWIRDEEGVIAAEYFIDNTGYDGEGIPMTLDNPGDTLVLAKAYLDISSLSEGRHAIFVHGKDTTGSWGAYGVLYFTVDRTPPLIENVNVVYPRGQYAARKGQYVTIEATIRDEVTSVDASTILLAPAFSDSGGLMYDDGTHGDEVAGDNVYTLKIPVTTDSTGTFAFTISASDIVPNEYQVTGWVEIDNESPYLSFTYSPVPEEGYRVYQKEIYLNVRGYDLPDSENVSVVMIEVRNLNGDLLYHKDITSTPEEEWKEKISLIPEDNVISVTIKDWVGNTTVLVDTIVYIVPEVSVEIGPEGGVVEAPDGAKVIIPSGALTDRVTITIERVFDAPPVQEGKDIKLVGVPHRFGPEDLVFRKPVTIVFPYTDFDLDRDQDGIKDIPEESLTVFYHDGFEWLKVGDVSVNADSNRVRFLVNHFTLFDLGVDEREISFSEFRSYFTRNPMRLGEGTSLVFFAPEEGRITVRIYDLYGDLVAVLVKDMEVEKGEHTLKWDGRTQFGRFLGSGIYIYRIDYEHGQQVEVYRGTLGVIK